MLVLMPDTSIILNISFLLLMVHNSSPLIEKLFESKLNSKYIYIFNAIEKCLTVTKSLCV